VESFLSSGTYAGGDAAGYVTLNAATGLDSDSLWGTAAGAVNGSTGGDDMLTMTQAWQYVTGIKYPQSMITERDGRYYCNEHYNAKFIPQDRDEEIMDLSDAENDIRSDDY